MISSFAVDWMILEVSGGLFHQLQALFIWVLAAAALALLIYVPYAEYVTSFLNEAITRDFEVRKDSQAVWVCYVVVAQFQM